MVTQTKTLSLPSITPLTGTLLDTATLVNGIEWLAPEGLFPSFNCLTTDREATWPCPDVYLDPPVQSDLATAATGGTVAADTYFVTVTALTGLGETLESNEESIVTTGSESTITVSWTAVTGATGYRIYATSGASGSETFLVEVDGQATDEYIWDGTPAIGTGQPPTASTAIVTQTKTFDGPEWLDGIRFAVYAGVSCKPFGYNSAEGLAQASRVFEAKESIGVEKALMETLLQGATDLTPAGGAVAPEVGLALLEGHASRTYAGVPTIHAPRSIGSLLLTRTAIEAQAGKFYSLSGSKIASGGGYDAVNLDPDGDPSPTGEVYLYATGEVVVARGTIIERDALNQTTNEDRVLVERPYIAAIDCYKSAVRVTVS